MKASILGAGGHARSLIPILLENNFVIEGIYDEHFSGRQEIYPNCYLIGKESHANFSCETFIASGDNLKRKTYFDKKQLSPVNLISRHAFIEPSATLQNSNQIMFGAFINSLCKIGNNNIINTKAIIEHECDIGNHNHIAIGVVLAGRVRIGSNCLIGANATIIQNISICDDVVIGAGAVVLENIVEPGLYVGVPARRVMR